MKEVYEELGGHWRNHSVVDGERSGRAHVVVMLGNGWNDLDQVAVCEGGGCTQHDVQPLTLLCIVYEKRQYIVQIHNRVEGIFIQ